MYLLCCILASNEGMFLKISYLALHMCNAYISTNVIYLMNVLSAVHFIAEAYKLINNYCQELYCKIYFPS